MKTIVQAYTGAFNAPVKGDAGDKADRILRFMDSAQALIIGWNTCAAFYEDLLKKLHQKGKQVFLWLPVFSEISGSVDEDFLFVAPTIANTAYIRNIYAEHFEGLAFDGVFLDKIRYGVYAGHPCAPDKREGMRYSFGRPENHAFYSKRAENVTKAVCSLTSFFHEKGLLVGLDVFAPSLAYLLGQDILALSERADFLKPMMYRKTTAPAGLPYEMQQLGGIGREVTRLWQATDMLSDEAFSRQLIALKDARCDVYAGIEVNCIPGICATDKAYYHQCIEAVQKEGIAGIVMSWNVLEKTIFD